MRVFKRFKDSDNPRGIYLHKSSHSHYLSDCCKCLNYRFFAITLLKCPQVKVIIYKFSVIFSKKNLLNLNFAHGCRLLSKGYIFKLIQPEFKSYPSICDESYPFIFRKSSRTAADPHQSLAIRTNARKRKQVAS